MFLVNKFDEPLYMCFHRVLTFCNTFPPRWGVSGKSKEAILDIIRAIEKSGGFHYTISYFWVHQVAFHIAAAIKGPAPSMFSFASPITSRRYSQHSMITSMWSRRS